MWPLPALWSTILPCCFHAAGRTIIFVTHNPDIARYSSRNIVLRDGVIKSDVANTDILSAADALAALPPVADE